MPERYVEAIIKFLSGREYQPLKPKQLARQMGVTEAEYGSFREAVKRLRDAGRIVRGVKNALILPEMGSTVVGVFRANPRGFGFVIPEEPNRHGDLFVPPDATGGALTGDHVIAAVRKRGKRGGEMVYRGEIVKILQRGNSRFVGTLRLSEDTWFVIPDGSAMPTPIVIPDIGTAGPGGGSKVVVEIVKYPSPGQLPTGVIVESLGEGGSMAVETLSVIRAHGLEDEFSEAALAEARAAVDAFDGEDAAGREDLTGRTIVTIDPPDARDYDDAISLDRNGDGTVTLGVHIADVSHFVPEGSALDQTARKRGTSVYFPRRVLPMLPEILANGVCSLQQGRKRFTKSMFITYDQAGRVLRSRPAEAAIRSAARLTYQQAQAICDGRTEGQPKKVVQLVRGMAKLARRIEARRREAGMLHLDLPAVELVFDEAGRVTDAVAEDDSYTHTIIEMFMVEANEAAARLLERKRRAFLRRIHPAPDPMSGRQVAAFIRACGWRLPPEMSPKDIQQLLDSVRGRPEQYAVNLAILRTFQMAEYSPRQVEHFALASKSYCHFTSPIRRYPDLTIHRLIAEHCRGRLDARPPEDLAELTQLGSDCSAAARRAEAAENELRDVLILQLLAGKVGEDFEGVVTGVANFGLFVQSPRYLIEGLVRMEDLGDDWWELDAQRGQIRGERSGRTFRIGDLLTVRIAGADVAKRQLNLVPDREALTNRPKRRTKKKAKAGTTAGSKRRRQRKR